MRPFDCLTGLGLGIAAGLAAYNLAKALLAGKRPAEYSIALAQEPTPEEARQLLALADFLQKATIGVG